MYRFTIYNLNNVKSDEVWLREEALREMYNRLYHLDSNKKATIAERGEVVNGVWSWKWYLICMIL